MKQQLDIVSITEDLRRDHREDMQEQRKMFNCIFSNIQFENLSLRMSNMSLKEEPQEQRKMFNIQMENLCLMMSNMSLKEEPKTQKTTFSLEQCQTGRGRYTGGEHRRGTINGRTRFY